MLRHTITMTLFLTASFAQAGTVDVEDILSTYNGVTSGDFNSSQEVEGRLFVGGNLTGTQIQTGFVSQLPAGPDQNVVVLGDTTIGKISGRGDLLIGGDANTNIEQSGGTLTTLVGGTFSGLDNFGSVTDGLAGDPTFDSQFPQIDFDGIIAYSAYLSGLTGEDLVFNDPNQKRFDALNNAVQSEGENWDAASVTILNTSIDQLSGGTFLTDVSMTETIIVNVSGTSGTYSLNAGVSKDVSQRILWNFYEAETVR
ncbi:MAG: collagen-binding domain-containing protein [Pseudomonadota bacterium]